MRDLWALVADAASHRVEERAGLEEGARALAEGRDDRLLLATCHRVELYGVGALNGETGRLAGTAVLTGEVAARRLLRVAAGLESAVVGEDEVLRQVRDTLAGAHPGLDTRLRRVFETAIAAGRRARRNRGRRPEGLAQRAVAWLGRQAALQGGSVLVAGAGRVGSSLAAAATAAGARVIVASRHREMPLAEAAQLAPDVAAIAVALAGPWPELLEIERPLPPTADLSAPPAVPRGRAARMLTIDDLYDRAGEEAGYRATAEAVVEQQLRELLSR